MKTLNQQPNFSAPSGYNLGNPISLDPIELKKEGIKIKSIKVSSDNTLYTTFHVNVGPYDMNIQELFETRYHAQSISIENLSDRAYAKLEAELKGHMNDWAKEKLGALGILRQACRSGKIIWGEFGEAPIELNVQFMLEPNIFYDLDEWIKLTIDLNVAKKELTLPSTTFNEMLVYYGSRGAAGGGLNQFNFAKDLAYAMPWAFQWRYSNLEVKVSCNKPTGGKTQISFGFDSFSPDYYSEEDIMPNNPIFQFEARPVL